MKVAIVHDWFVSMGGAEKVVKEIIAAYPEADIYSVVDFMSDEDRKYYLSGKKVTTTFIQNFPSSKNKYRNYLPFMPLAIEQLDVTEYDIVISSSHAVAKGVLTGPDQLHICYCHSPIRYAWDLQFQYLKESGLVKGVKSTLARLILHKIRRWDYRTANSVDYFIANSNFIKRRIEKIYRRNASVIYPNVAVEDFNLKEEKKDYYFTASRMVPYKKIDLIVKAFNMMPDKELIVIGDGPDFKKIKDIAKENVKLLGYQKFSVLKDYMENAKAFVFAAEEDFGIVPVEAQACGTPVIAYGKGGLLETVVDQKTGVFFDRQDENSIVEAVKQLDSIELLPPSQIRNHAESFSTARFRKEILDFVSSCIKQHENKSRLNEGYLYSLDDDDIEAYS